MTHRRRRVVLSTVLTVGVLALLGYGLTRDPFVLPSPLVGKPAPAFVLPVMPEAAEPGLGRWEARDSLRLEETEGGVVVLNFWASWCLACREEHGALSAAADRYRDRGVRFFGILYQDTPPAARSFIREMGGQSYPTLLDPGTRMALDYGVYGVPETYFVGIDGRVAHRHIGPVTTEILQSRIDSLLAASPTDGSEPGSGTRPSGS